MFGGPDCLAAIYGVVAPLDFTYGDWTVEECNQNESLQVSTTNEIHSNVFQWNLFDIGLSGYPFLRFLEYKYHSQYKDFIERTKVPYVLTFFSPFSHTMSLKSILLSYKYFVKKEPYKRAWRRYTT